MNREPIIIVAGEPNSIFLEIFFKSLKINNYKSPLIIIASKKLLQKQMKELGFNYPINIINKNFNKFDKLNNSKINLINVNYKFKNCFEKISNKSNNYIKESFDLGLKICLKNKLTKFINGPISKKHFLGGKSLGITEYLAKQTKKDNMVAMLIFNKKLSVTPITTHLALKDVHKNISKKKYTLRLTLFLNFIRKNSIEK
jgi:4-hydroxythreonine-4-phosphate dehydrogenase